MESSAEQRAEAGGASRSYDAVVVGASLAGCSAAILLGRAGARVALVEKRPDPRAFKRVCTHFIQASAIPTLERLDLLEPMMEAGAVRYVNRIWTRWGWVQAPRDRVAHSINLPREALDPIVRDAAAATPGVDLLLGRSAIDVLREEGGACGVTVRDREGEEEALLGQLVVGADGRDSRVAEIAGLSGRRLPHGRFVYSGYFEGPPPEGAPDPSALAARPAVRDRGAARRGDLPLRGDADQGPAGGVQERSRGGSRRLLRGAARSAPDSRIPPRRPDDRQAGDARTGSEGRSGRASP